MGEIKSAIELAMERTRNLVPDRAEREALARRECEERVRAVVRRLLDGSLRVELAPRELEALERDRPDFPWRVSACRELVLAADPGVNHDTVLAALERLECPSREPLRAAVDRLLQDEDDLRRDAEQRQRERLAGLGVSGSALVPNPEADPEWEARRAEGRAGFSRELEGLAG